MKIIKRPLNKNSQQLSDYSDNNYTKLNESGYSRIWDHCSNGFFIISAYLNEIQFINNKDKIVNNYDKNIELNNYNELATNKLKNKLRSLGYGFIEQKGYYGSDPEVSFFVPFNSNDDYIDNKAYDDAINLMIDFYQESIIIYDKYSNDSGIYYLYSNGNVEYAGEFHKIEDITKYMGIIKGKSTGYTFLENLGIRTIKGYLNSSYYLYKRNGYIPIKEDFTRLIRLRFINKNN